MSSEPLLLRCVLVSGSGLIYWAGVLIQGRRIRKQIGRSPNLKPRGAREKALWFGWFLVILVWIGQPPLIGFRPTALHLWPGMLNSTTMALGSLLMALGYAGTLWSYGAMGNTWRIGINKREKTELVSRGPYRWVRHPIYLFQIVMLGGAALLLPTLLSLAALLAHYICALIKARDEENYLETVHGTAYSDYQSKSGGLFPRWSKHDDAQRDICARH